MSNKRGETHFVFDSVAPASATLVADFLSPTVVDEEVVWKLSTGDGTAVESSLLSPEVEPLLLLSPALCLGGSEYVQIGV